MLLILIISGLCVVVVVNDEENEGYKLVQYALP